MSRYRAPLIAPLVLAMSCLMCLAQVEQGAISGVVSDATGAFIAKAKVTAKNQATGVVAVAETTDEGYYKIPYLPAGKYDLSIEMDGFSTNRVTSVPVLVGQIATIDSTLRPGAVHDEITVMSNAVMIDQVSSSIGYVTGALQIVQLPKIGTFSDPNYLDFQVLRPQRERQPESRNRKDMSSPNHWT
jgi:hypothetical protein